MRTASPIITDDWTVWQREAGAEFDTFASEIHCGTLAFAMNAIMEGLGVGIGRSLLVSKDLLSGRLVAPFEFRYHSQAGYHLLSRPERSALPKVQTFKRWLLAHLGAA